MKTIRFFCAGVLLLILGFTAPIHSQQQDDKNKQQPPKQQEQPKQQQQQQQQPPKQQPQQQQPKQQPQQQSRPPQQQQPKQQPQQQSRPPQQQPPKQQPQQQSRTPQQQPPKQQPQQQSRQPQQGSGGAYHGGVSTTAPTNGGVHPSGVPQHSGQVRSGFTQSRATSWTTQHRTWQQRGGYNGYRIPDDRFSLYFGPEHFFRLSALPLLFVGGYPRFQYDGYWVTFLDPWPEDWPPDWYETDNIYIEFVDGGYYVCDQNYPGIAIAVTISM
jgi:hypothetical protein